MIASANDETERIELARVTMIDLCTWENEED